MGADFAIQLLDDPVVAVSELALVRSRWAAEQGRKPSDNDPFDTEFAEWVQRESAGRRFWVARVDEEPVGMVNLLIFDRMPTVGKPSGGWGYLCNMYVDETHRNAGLGAELATAVLRYADDQGLERVVLSPSERSRPFYASLGFQAASQLLVRPAP